MPDPDDYNAPLDSQPSPNDADPHHLMTLPQSDIRGVAMSAPNDFCMHTSIDNGGIYCVDPAETHVPYWNDGANP